MEVLGRLSCAQVIIGGSWIGKRSLKFCRKSYRTKDLWIVASKQGSILKRGGNPSPFRRISSPWTRNFIPYT
jgi:hypothetical protein